MTELERLFQDVSPPWYGVVGWPVDHSLSPVMQTAALSAFGIKGVYRAVAVPPMEWDVFWARAIAHPGWEGFNVTVPHKERAAAALHHRSPALEACGAANTLWRTPSGWEGDNTDAPALAEDLDNAGFPWRDARVVLLGAGGAARAALFALAGGNPRAREIVVHNRTAERARALVESMRQLVRGDVRLGRDLESDLQGADVLINATSAGLKAGDPSPAPASCLRPGLAVYDMVYHRDTALLNDGRLAGARVCNGLGMLVAQGARAFERWFGTSLSNNINYTPSALRAVMRAAVETTWKERTPP